MKTRQMPHLSTNGDWDNETEHKPMTVAQLQRAIKNNEKWLKRYQKARSGCLKGSSDWHHYNNAVQTQMRGQSNLMAQLAKLTQP